jgi:hypothetical protein
LLLDAIIVDASVALQGFLEHYSVVYLSTLSVI